MIKKAYLHFRTITHHKRLVMEGCFKLGLYRQGLLHDLSKYGPSEFFVGCRYYQGYMSPNNAERKAKGYSSAWLHHKGKNKHHLEYWIDYPADETEDDGRTGMSGMKMPVRLVCEMFVDRVSACKNYKKDDYRDDSAILYYYKSVSHYIIHPDTAALLEFMLTMLAVRGEERTFAYIRRNVLTGRVPYEAGRLSRATHKLGYRRKEK